MNIVSTLTLTALFNLLVFHLINLRLLVQQWQLQYRLARVWSCGQKGAALGTLIQTNTVDRFNNITCYYILHLLPVISQLDITIYTDVVFWIKLFIYYIDFLFTNGNINNAVLQLEKLNKSNHDVYDKLFSKHFLKLRININIFFL